MLPVHPQSAQSPLGAHSGYNPQQWAPQGRSDIAEPSHSSPLPPPPYSPPRSQQGRPPSSLVDHSPFTPSATPPRFSMANVMRPSPEGQTSFPPPPGQGSRATSRDRRFGLPSLGRRRESEQFTTTSEPRQAASLTRQSMGPLTFRTPDIGRSHNMSPANVFPPQPGAPAARRAASAGAVTTPTSGRSRSTSQTRWEPGMPVPPPPPGPPPSSSRSQSVQPMNHSNVPIISPPTRRPPPTSGATSLGPVPPTPADWLDSDTPPPPAEPSPTPLAVDTTITDNAASPEPSSASPSSAVLARTGAVRHDKTILQRRAESRTRHRSSASVDASTRPQSISDIQVPSTGGYLNRQLAATKLTPRSGGRLQTDEPASGGSLAQLDSRNSTPRAIPAGKLPQIDTGTPPLSPYVSRSRQHASASRPAGPNALPTPPSLTQSASSLAPREASRPPSGHMLSRTLVVEQCADEFAAGAIERYQTFVGREISASTDTARVRLFAEFFVNESRIRRERYASAMKEMGSEVLDLTRDLFRPMHIDAGGSGSNQHRGDLSSSVSSAGRADQQPLSAPSSAGLPSPGGTNANGQQYTSAYQPQLSPILSMSVSENYENGSSRGRPPSRWWETESQGDGSRSFERSRRESKYMGVPKKHWAEDEPESSAQSSSSQYAAPDMEEYPPEKLGWHETESATSSSHLARHFDDGFGSSPSPAMFHQNQLDVSRLVTLPPPYPRHHPAVNNNHPELTETRTAVRALHDLSRVKVVQEEFATKTQERREDAAKTASQRQEDFKANLQREVSTGKLGFSDAASLEASSAEEERKRIKELEKSEYEHFQNDVVVPLNQLLLERIERASSLFDALSGHLFDGSEHDADLPQEEGDDKPELLEKLTLLKWIFEAREALHKQNYDLLSDRNARYCEVVVTPYRLAGNSEKVRGAESFFQEDAEKREFAYANEVLDRAREFRAIVEKAVQRGVTIQSSAFWDVAPPLSRLLERIPPELEGFLVHIPPSEFDENPAYHEHPLQYLYSLLLHSEKSTYQFIESHTNLLCLLHEVKEAVVVAKARYLQTQTEDDDGNRIETGKREDRAVAMRRVEDLRLSEDLKEKVRTVQEQWHSALGESMQSVKGRTGEWLLSTGGWDESLEDGGVGVH